MRFSRIKTFWIILLCIVLCLSIPAKAQEWQWSGVERVVGIADIHGAYDSFVRLLQHAELVNDELDWTGGNTHLVIVGDVLDRGAGSRKALDLIMRLETQAGESGGRVHMVLGNHEIMNLTGDLGYVSEEEFASYAGDEAPVARQAAFSRFVQQADPGVDERTLKLEFDKKFPRGFFGHRKLFAVDGHYGSWLVDKPVMVKVNDSIFVHGGLSSAIAGTQGGALNAAYNKLLREYLEHWQVLSGTGLLPPEADFYAHETILAEHLDGPAQPGTGISGDVTASAKRMIELNNSSLLRIQSVIWYRGNVLCNAVMAESRLDQALQDHGAARLVVGHTPTHNRRVLNRFEGKLIRADTGMLKPYYNGQPAAAIIENGRVMVLYVNEDGVVETDPQPRQVGSRPDRLSDAELETLLTDTDLREVEKRRDGSRLMELDHNGQALKAVFTPAVSKRRNRVFIPEVAAYRLDRLLGFDLIPVTVSRTLDGDPGALSLSQDTLVSEQTRHEQNLGGGAWCPLTDQFNMMYVFDILAYNEGRTPEEIRYTRGSWQLVLTGNRNLFATKNDKPRYLANAPVTLPALLAARLQQLDEERLSTSLGDVLDERRRRALFRRAELLLETGN